MLLLVLLLRRLFACNGIAGEEFGIGSTVSLIILHTIGENVLQRFALLRRVQFPPTATGRSAHAGLVDRMTE